MKCLLIESRERKIVEPVIRVYCNKYAGAYLMAVCGVLNYKNSPTHSDRRPNGLGKVLNRLVKKSLMTDSKLLFDCRLGNDKP